MSEENTNKLLMNGVEVKLKNPGTKGLGDFLNLAKALSKVPEDVSEKEFMEYLDDRAIKSFENLLHLTLEKTFPEITTEIDEWAMENAMMILPEIIKLCSPKNIEQEKKERLMERINGNKSA